MAAAADPVAVEASPEAEPSEPAKIVAADPVAVEPAAETAESFVIFSISEFCVVCENFIREGYFSSILLLINKIFQDSKICRLALWSSSAPGLLGYPISQRYSTHSCTLLHYYTLITTRCRISHHRT